MDIQAHIDRVKGGWIVEGKAEERRDIALRLVQDGISVEQVVRCAGFTVEEVQGLCPKQKSMQTFNAQSQGSSQWQEDDLPLSTSYALG